MRLLIFFVAFSFQSLALPVCYSQTNRESEMGLSYMLTLGGIEEGLGLTEEQSDGLYGLWMNIETELKFEFEKYQAAFSENLSADAREDLKVQLELAINTIRDKEYTLLSDRLSESQLARLKQIRIQYLKRTNQGIEALEFELKLTAEQITQIEKIRASLQKELNQVQTDSREKKMSQLGISRETEALQDRAQQDVLAILTADQRRQIAELEGEKFEFHTAANKAEREAAAAAAKKAAESAGGEKDKADGSGD